MDPATIGVSVIALLTPLAKNVMQEFTGMAGDVVLGKVKDLREWLKRKLSGDQYATETLERFETEPDTYGGPLRAVITEKMEREPTLADELTEKIEDIERTAPTISVVQKMKKARHVIGVAADQVGNADIKVNQVIDDAEHVTGVKIGGSKDEDSQNPNDK